MLACILEPRGLRHQLLQVEHAHAEERAQLSAKLHLVKAGHKRMKVDMQTQVDKTAATAAELAVSQVGHRVA